MPQPPCFILNDEYAELLKENASYHLKVRDGRRSYNSEDYKDLQRRLTRIEVKMYASDIIAHAEYLFPKVGS